jgi:putative endonuclease
MYYVYLLRSLTYREEIYIGLAGDLRARIKKHNEGGSFHTSKFKPWKLVLYLSFDSKEKAASFERYLKSGSGRSFAKRHFW